MNPYKILGIDETASDEEVKAAYRTMAAKYHPDVGGDAWVFQQVREAFDEVTRLRSHGKAKDSNSTSSASAAPRHPAGAASRAGQAGSGKARDPSRSQERAQPSAPESTPLARWLHAAFKRQLPLQSETSTFILINVLDIVMTNILLRANAIEANPFAKYFFDRWGFRGMIAFKMLSVAVVCILTQWIAIKNLYRAKQVLYLGCILVGFVVLYSCWLLVRR